MTDRLPDLETTKGCRVWVLEDGEQPPEGTVITQTANGQTIAWEVRDEKTDGH